MAWGTGCSAVKASMSAARAGSFTARMPESMRTMLFDGKRSFISSQRSWTSRHAWRPLSRLAMQAPIRNGAFCVRTAGVMASSSTRAICSGSRTSASA